MTLQVSPYARMVDYAEQLFQDNPLYAQTLRDVEHKVPSDSEMDVLHRINEMSGVLDRETFHPLIGVVLRKIIASKTSNYAHILQDLVSGVQALNFSISNQEVDFLYKLIENNNQTNLPNSWIPILNFLSGIVILENQNDYAKQLVQLGVFNWVSRLLNSGNDPQLTDSITELCAQLFIKANPLMRKAAHEANLLRTALTLPHIPCKLAAALSFYGEELDSESTKSLLKRTKHISETQPRHDEIYKLFIQANLAGRNILQNQENIVISFWHGDLFRLMVYKDDATWLGEDLYGYWQSKALQFLAGFARNPENRKSIAVLETVDALLERKKAPNLSLDDRILITSILCRLSPLTAKDIHPTSRPFYRYRLQGLFETHALVVEDYKEIDVPFKTLQVCSKVKNSQLPKNIVKLIGIYYYASI